MVHLEELEVLLLHRELVRRSREREVLPRGLGGLRVEGRACTMRSGDLGERRVEAPLIVFFRTTS